MFACVISQSTNKCVFLNIFRTLKKRYINIRTNHGKHLGPIFAMVCPDIDMTQYLLVLYDNLLKMFFVFQILEL